MHKIVFFVLLVFFSHELPALGPMQSPLETKADINAQDHFGTTELMVAARDRHIETLKSLLAAGADLNIQDILGGTAIMKAAALGYQDIVQLLLDAGADITIKNNFNQDAIAQAENMGRLEVLRILLIHSGVDVEDPKVRWRLKPVSSGKRRPDNFFTHSN
jgi:ankyrin repeat protein